MNEARMACPPDGPVSNLAPPYPFEILQAAPGQVIIMNELNNQIRAIALDTPVPNHEELMILPYYSGYSYGRYEGDTLVVETLGFKEQTFLDATGAPHTDELKTTEHIRRISSNQL